MTGAARGTGEAVARLFAAEGAKIVLGDLLDAEGRRVAGEIGNAADYVHLDVTSETDWQRAVEGAEERHGALHVLYNNVGIPGAAGLELTQEEWDFGLEVNARASFFLSGYLTSALKAAHGASVIFTSSTSGLIGSPFSPMYSFTKGGIIALVRSMAHNMTVLQKYRGAMMDTITEFVNSPEMSSEEAANLMADAVEAQM